MSQELVPQPERDHPDQADSADPAPPQAGGRRVERSVFTPPIDIYESDEGLVLHADLPGVTLDTLELEVQDNKLTLFGRVRSVVPPGAVALHQEYEVGDFLRSFILSDEVDHERITATLNNGVLRVLLPRAERPEPRRIHVSTEPPPGP
jgi:HSP20 family molecular chaperone IbpA